MNKITENNAKNNAEIVETLYDYLTCRSGSIKLIFHHRMVCNIKHLDFIRISKNNYRLLGIQSS